MEVLTNISGFSIKDAMTVVHALMLYEYNVHKDIILEAIYGDHLAEGYYREKLELLNTKGILYIYGRLDNPSRRRLVKAVLLKYGDESRRATGNLPKE